MNNENKKFIIASLLILGVFIFGILLIFFNVPKDSINLLEAIILGWLGTAAGVGVHYFTRSTPSTPAAPAIEDKEIMDE